MEDFYKKSYLRHRSWDTQDNEERHQVQQSWFEEDTVDYWRHIRMLEPLTTLLQHYKHSECVTIGDGRFGLDSVKLKKIEPSLQILPTDINPHFLQKGKEQGIIADYKVENAEQLSFNDKEFDLTFCIESYHHFPRPNIAMYEMLRVSRKAVVLIEPKDRFPLTTPLKMYMTLKKLSRKVLGKTIHIHSDYANFEPVGNYVYSIAEREIEKIGMGLQLPVVAFYGFNDHYEKGLEFEKVSKDSKLFRKTKNKIRFRDFLCKIGLLNYKMVITIIFKENISKEVATQLQKTGFKVVFLPKNPYLTSYS